MIVKDGSWNENWKG